MNKPRSFDLHELYAAHLEWLGIRSTLPSMERKQFVRWILRVYPAIGVEHSELVKFRMMCQEIQRGGKVPRTKGIGEATVRNYAKPLSRVYQTLTEKVPFQTFVNSVLSECQTERSLRRFLANYLTSL